MPSLLPPEIRVEAVRDDVSYQLPVRSLGKLRLVGMVPLAFGLFFISMPLHTLIGTLQGVMSGKTSGVFQSVFAAFMTTFLVAGLMPVGIGLVLLFGRCRVEWREKRLSTVEQIGPFGWRRRLMIPKSCIRKLTVSAGTTRVNGKVVTTGTMANLAAMAAEFDSGKPRLVAIGYPRDWLQAVAEDLSRRAGVSSPLAGRPVVEILDEANPLQAAPEEVERPPGTAVRVEPTSNGLSMVVPPVGVRKGGKGLLGFSIMWCLFMAAFTFAWGAGAHSKSRAVPWPLWLFIAAFWAIGLGMLTGAINMGKRRALLLVANGRLKVAYSGIWGTKQWEWPRESIAAIRADGSGMEVNHRPVPELQVHPVGGRKVGFFAGRPENELRWMAFELRRALEVPAEAGAAVGRGAAARTE